MPAIWPLIPIFAFLLQNAGVPPVPADALSPDETARLEKEVNVERRIKVYEEASARIQQSLVTAVNKEDFQTVPDRLKAWTTLLTKSLQDIETNLKAKNKSKQLIKYEIQLRKSIATMQGYKIKAPADLQDDFDACSAQAEKVRKRFVEILFPR